MNLTFLATMPNKFSKGQKQANSKSKKGKIQQTNKKFNKKAKLWRSNSAIHKRKFTAKI